MKGLVRRLPPIAWRDAKLREWREENRKLKAQLAAARKAGARPPWVRPSDEEARRLIRRSGLFDESWFLGEVQPPPGVDLVQYWLDHHEDRSPHPGFIPEWYVAELRRVVGKRMADEAEASPLLHYLTVGARRGIAPHPLMDPDYAERYPDSRQHPGGTLGHLLAQIPSDEQTGIRAGLAPHDFLRRAEHVGRLIRETRGFSHLERDRPDFDAAAEAEFKRELRRVDLPDPPPLVSVVVPTRNRAEAVARAVASVVAQSYPHWELLLVDDGSTDDTRGRLTDFLRDPRIRYLRHEASRGVAAARNTGLRHATGHYVAYLDSDNTWYPDFLELMVRFMHRESAPVAYAMSALVEEGANGRRLYRGMPFSRSALLERNFIDCIVLVHERRLLDEVGVFDESLRRNVDWDLFIRLASVCDFAFAPFLATEYDVWDTRGDRITTDEPSSYRFVVRQRALIDWEAVDAQLAERVPGRLTAVVVVSSDPVKAVETVNRLLSTARGDVEVVVVDSHLAEVDSAVLLGRLCEEPRVILHRTTQALPLEVCRNLGATLGTGEYLAFVSENLWSEPGWDTGLVDALDEHVVVQPLVLLPGGSVWSAGVDFLPQGREILRFHNFSGDAPEVRHHQVASTVASICLAVRAREFVAARGFDPRFVRHLTGSELGLRLTSDTGRTAACVISSVMALREPLTGPSTDSSRNAAWNNEHMLTELAQQRTEVREGPATPEGLRVEGFLQRAIADRAVTALYVHDRPERPLRWALKIAAPTVERRTNWGDWHFARALAASLERLGQIATVDCKDSWYRPTVHLDDVTLYIRGTSVYDVNPGHINIAWVISHPERVSASELNHYDLVFGASARWCDRMSDKLGRPIEPLLQCTDHRRFRPVAPSRDKAHPVLVVANARGMRPAVAAALEAGVVPAVYGVRWAGLLPEGSWKGEYIPNEELPAVYSAAGTVLNDHWEDMREQGIVSNRLFDLVACEARVISDHLPEVDELFEGVVLTYDRAEDIPDLIQRHLNETPDQAARRRAVGQMVRERHTFDARAQFLCDRVAELRRERQRAK